MSTFSMFVAPALAIPAGLVGVPDSNVVEDFPAGSDPSLRAADLEGSVMTSTHANTMSVIVTTPERASDYMDDGAQVGGSGEIAIVLRDTLKSEGRKVAIDAAAVTQALGYEPDRVYGTHEDGTQWSSQVEYQSGLMVFEVPHFSSNTVTFSGEVQLQGTPATDGATYSYEVSDADSVSAPNVTFTGTVSTEWDNRSSSSVSLGESFDAQVAGNLDATGPASGSPRVTVSTSGETIAHSTTESDMSHTWDSHSLSYVSTVKVGIAEDGSGDGDGSTHSADYEVVIGGTTEASGTLTIHDDDTVGGNTAKTTVDINRDISTSTDITVQLTSGDSSYLNLWDPEASSSTHSVSVSSGLETKSLGTFTGTKSTDLALSPSSDSITVDASGGSLDSVSVELKERTQTADPRIEINGNVVGHSGILAGGETTMLSGTESDVQSETNIVNVSVGSGSLSGDAPTPAVEFTYGHDAVDQQVVEYTGQKWSESYEVNKTYASDRSSATLTIPFADDVVGIHNLERQTNGGGWTTVSTDNYDFNGTTLTVDLGSVQGGDTVEVRTTARKVNAINGEVTVVEPTPMGDRLDTKFRVDSWSSDAYLSVGGSPDGQRIHYTYNDDGRDDHTVVTSSGYNRLYLGNVSAGDQMRASTIPLRVNAVSNEVMLRVEEPSTTELEVVVSPGSNLNDAVEYTFLDAADGEKYILYSETNDIVHDSATANSPVTLTDDDSSETLRIEQDSSSTSSGDGGSGGSFWKEGSAVANNYFPAMPVLNPGLVAALVLVLIAGAFLYTERRADERGIVDPQPVYRRPLVLFATVLSLGLGVFLISPQTITTPLQTALNAALPLAGVLGVTLAVGAIAYWLYTRRQSKVAEANTPDNVFQLAGERLRGGDDGNN